MFRAEHILSVALDAGLTTPGDTSFLVQTGGEWPLVHAFGSRCHEDASGSLSRVSVRFGLDNPSLLCRSCFSKLGGSVWSKQARVGVVSLATARFAAEQLRNPDTLDTDILSAAGRLRLFVHKFVDVIVSSGETPVSLKTLIDAEVPGFVETLEFSRFRVSQVLDATSSMFVKSALIAGNEYVSPEHLSLVGQCGALGAEREPWVWYRLSGGECLLSSSLLGALDFVPPFPTLWQGAFVGRLPLFAACAEGAKVNNVLAIADEFSSVAELEFLLKSDLEGMKFAQRNQLVQAFRGACLT